jgi:hypothetical protein
MEVLCPIMRTAIISATLVLAVTMAAAQTYIVEDYINSGKRILPAYKAALIAPIDRSLADRVDGSFLAGMCVGYIRAIHTFAGHIVGFRFVRYIPTGVTTEQMIRVVIRYVEARPQRMDEPHTSGR